MKAKNFKEDIVNKVIKSSELIESQNNTKLQQIGNVLGLNKPLSANDAIDMLHCCVINSSFSEAWGADLHRLGFIVCKCGCDKWFKIGDNYYNDQIFTQYIECGHYLYKAHSTESEFMAEYCPDCVKKGIFNV